MGEAVIPQRGSLRAVVSLRGQGDLPPVLGYRAWACNPRFEMLRSGSGRLMRGGMKLVALLFTLITLGSCTSGPARLETMPPEQLRELSHDALCDAYSLSRADNLKAEIERRGLIDGYYWISSRLYREMSRMDLICSRGYPRDINRTVSEYGTSEQWVYRPCDLCDATYVYLEEDKVTGWQE